MHQNDQNGSAQKEDNQNDKNRSAHKGGQIVP